MYHGDLTDDDIQFLDALGKTWRLTPKGVPQFGPMPRIQFGDALFIDSVVLPHRLQPSTVNMMFVLPPHYPGAFLDMFYLDRPVARIDGRPLRAIAPYPVGNIQWWRWSRHRASNSWRPGIDGVATHYQLIENALMADAA